MSIEHSLYRYIRPLLPAVLVLLLLTVLSCRRTPDSVLRSMDRAEALMEEHPDSALSILQKVDTADLHGAPDRARRALLMSMALDKNYIDTTDFSVLRPALDYYETHGTPDQRLKTRYYQGCIYMNRGEDDAALNALLRAAEDSATCKDSLALARLYSAQGMMYYRQDAIRSALNCNLKARKLFEILGDKVNVDITNTKILENAIGLKDTLLLIKTLPEVERIDPSFVIISSTPSAVVLTAHNFLDDDATLRVYIEDFEKNTPSQVLHNHFVAIDRALIHDRLGNHSKAMEIIDSLPHIKEGPGFGLPELLKYNIISAEVYEHSDQTLKSLEAYKDFIDNSTRQYDYMLNSGVLYTKDHYLNDVDRVKDEIRHTLHLLIGFITFLVCLIAVLFFLILSRKLKEQYRYRGTIRKTENIKTTRLILTNKDLETTNQKVTGKNLELTQTNSKLALSISRLRDSMSNLNDKLKRALQRKPVINRIIYPRNKAFDDFLIAVITEQPTKDNEVGQFIKSVKKDVNKALEYIVSTYENSHPDMMAYLKSHDLNREEIGYSCLLLLPLENKQIEKFMGLKRPLDYSTNIRKKLNVPSRGKTLKKFLSEIH